MSNVYSAGDHQQLEAKAGNLQKIPRTTGSMEDKVGGKANIKTPSKFKTPSTPILVVCCSIL